jgi:hypothetical protein
VLLVATAGFSNKLLIRTKSGLLEYSASEIRSITFDGAATPTHNPQFQLPADWSTRVLVRQVAARLAIDIRLKPGTSYTARLYSMSGALVATLSGTSSAKTVNFITPSALGSGVYLFRLKTPSETITRTAIKR